MDLKTRYLGLDLEHPFIVGASPLTEHLDSARRLEDAGAAAIVMNSLFEEQIQHERDGLQHLHDEYADSGYEFSSLMPDHPEYSFGSEEYLETLRSMSDALDIPVMASLNGYTMGGWIDHALKMQQAGAHALELNLFSVAADPNVSGESVEIYSLEVVESVREAIEIPLAVKISPYYSSLAHFARGLDALGIDGLVLFNRFYQPQIDIEELEVVPELELSDSSELLLRIRWLAILSAEMRASLAVTGGVHIVDDAIKALMAGADTVQMVSAILKRGPRHLQNLVAGVKRWLEENEYDSLAELRGNMSLKRCPDATAYSRAQYMRTLHSWRAE